MITVSYQRLDTSREADAMLVWAIALNAGNKVNYHTHLVCVTNFWLARNKEIHVSILLVVLVSRRLLKMLCLAKKLWKN